MGLTKYGHGDDQKVLPEPGDDQKTAKANWTEQDAEELKQENEEADGTPA